MEKLYIEIRELLKSTKQYNININMRNFNAKIEKCKFENKVEPYGLGMRKELNNSTPFLSSKHLGIFSRQTIKCDTQSS